METLKLRVYEGRKLLYDRHSNIVNKNNVITIDSVHYERKFLELFHTLGPVKVVIEEIYNAKYVKNKQSERTKVAPEREAQLRAMLEEKQSVKAKATEKADPIAAENEDLKAHIAKLDAKIEKIMADLAPSKAKGTNDETVIIDYSRKLKPALILIANEQGIKIPEDATKADIIALLKK